VQTVRDMLERNEWVIIEQHKTTTLQATAPTAKPKPRGANLTAMARAGIMILGWFFARELFNAAGQGKLRGFLSQGLKMAWNFENLTADDFMHFYMSCADVNKVLKVKQLESELLLTMESTRHYFGMLSAPFEYRADNLNMGKARNDLNRGKAFVLH
jgi:hypothetical protein